MAAKIFLAHASEDKAQIRTLYADLKARGFDPWLDEIDLVPGQIWKVEIPKAIGRAGVFLACLSSRSVGKVGFVQNEFRIALSALGARPSGTIFLIPVRLDECDIPDLQIPDLGLSLRDIQWVDLWQEGAFDRLFRAIESALDKPNEAQRPGPAEKVAIPLADAPDQASLHVTPDDTNVNFLSQPINNATLLTYTKWRYPQLPISSTVQERLFRDLSYTNIRTLGDLDRVMHAARPAVDEYNTQAHDVFRTGTDFLTKSLGFVDNEFREKHGFSPQTREAFSKYEHLVQSETRRKAAPDQKASEEPPGPAAAPHWQNPIIVAAIIGAIGAVAAALSPLLFDGGGSDPKSIQDTTVQNTDGMTNIPDLLLIGSKSSGCFGSPTYLPPGQDQNDRLCAPFIKYDNPLIRGQRILIKAGDIIDLGDDPNGNSRETGPDGITIETVERNGLKYTPLEEKDIDQGIITSGQLARRPAKNVGALIGAMVSEERASQSHFQAQKMAGNDGLQSNDLFLITSIAKFFTVLQLKRKTNSSR